MKSTLNREDLQKHFDSVLESAIDGILIIDEWGCVIECNQAINNLFGYSREELIGDNLNKLMPAPHRKNHDGYMQNYLRTGIAKIIGIGREVEGLRKDGTQFPFRLAVGEVKLKEGSFFTGFVHDLTSEVEARNQLKSYASLMEEKVHQRTAQLEEEVRVKERAEIELMESQKLYEAIAFNFPNGTINVLDPDLRFLFVEGSGLKQIGLGTKDLLGKSYLELIDPLVKDEVAEKLHRVFEGNSENFEIEFKNLVFRVRAVPLPNENNAIDRILLVETNITQQKTAEQEIFNSLQKERELSELKSKFVSMASHEFRTPLSTILSSASLVERYESTEDQGKRKKHIDRIKGNVRNLTMILNDFLSLEKLDANSIRTHIISFDVIAYIHEITENLQAIKKPGQKIEVICSKKECHIKTDQFMLQNILNNLVSNAIKYSGSNSEIKIRISCEENDMKISVSDNGLGISEEDQSFLFNRFFRASNAGHEQGTGLGLHIVKRYVDLLEGSISFESELGKGTTFTVKLNNIAVTI